MGIEMLLYVFSQIMRVHAGSSRLREGRWQGSRLQVEVDRILVRGNLTSFEALLLSREEWHVGKWEESQNGKGKRTGGNTRKMPRAQNQDRGSSQNGWTGQ